MQPFSTSVALPPNVIHDVLDVPFHASWNLNYFSGNLLFSIPNIFKWLLQPQHPLPRLKCFAFSEQCSTRDFCDDLNAMFDNSACLLA